MSINRWSAGLDEQLDAAVAANQMDWAKVGSMFPGRDVQALQKRWAQYQVAKRLVPSSVKDVSLVDFGNRPKPGDIPVEVFYEVRSREAFLVRLGSYAVRARRLRSMSS